jgi:hypothetical protein
MTSTVWFKTPEPPPQGMDPADVVTNLRAWFASERLEVREQQDPRAVVHLAVKYPPGPRGHTFNVVVPKGRDLVAISSVTRVDAGQQEEMREVMADDDDEWRTWIHDMRMHLIGAGVDWNLSMGHDGTDRPGPLQAFNVSLPVWFDGLTKNEVMQSLRTLWMSKLGLIHEIKFGFGQGTGTPGQWTIGISAVVNNAAIPAGHRCRKNGLRSKSATTKRPPLGTGSIPANGRKVLHLT